ncbi:hypothetical protein CGMCC3_g4543 [Colletotrichum fructicola]|nr:uncharacterized protein CGMCC3_g4543 [Colletotrichum fructicola]KAE9579461.1 hypothetical protein CGMCC3_g4543 [Colletotrichum fructicola]
MELTGGHLGACFDYIGRQHPATAENGNRSNTTLAVDIVR